MLGLSGVVTLSPSVYVCYSPFYYVLKHIYRGYFKDFFHCQFKHLGLLVRLFHFLSIGYIFLLLPLFFNFLSCAKQCV